MSTTEYTITGADTGPTLEESAVALGIDLNSIDSTADEQFSPPVKPAVEKTEEEKPAKILGKFESQDDLIKAYSELEKKLGNKVEETKPEAKVEPTAEQTDTEAKADETTEAAKEAVEKAGLDLNALSTEFWANNGLSEDSYTKLEKAGIPKALVDQYAAGQRAILDGQRNTVFTEVGGEQNYNAMLDWARDNFSKDEVAAFDKAVNSGDMGTTLFAVKGLHARYRANGTVEPSQTITGGNRSSSGGAFKSMAEVMTAMSDPRYKNDAAYVDDVVRRMALSNL